MIDLRTQAWFDQLDAHVATVIGRHGWYIQYVGGGCCAAPGCDGGQDDGPPFAYTVGLFGLHHPELLIFGVPPETAVEVLNTLGERVRSGKAILPGHVITFGHHRILPERVPNPGEIVFEANRYYKRDDEHSVPVLQLSYDDGTGRFPWDPGYAEAEMQPRPGTFRA